MKISYLILAHKNPIQFQRLINSLNSKNVNFFIHVDKSTDDAPFKEPFLNKKNIFFLSEEKRMVTPWSSIGTVKATLNLLKESVEMFNSRNYCVLLSGQDYPIKNNDYIYDFYNSNYGLNYVAINDITDIWPNWRDRFERYNFHLPNKRLNRGIYPYRDKRFFKIKNFKDIFYLYYYIGAKTTLSTIFKDKRALPNYIVPKGGGTWWALPVETAINIIDYLERHPDFLTYHSYTHVSDETFFASIVNEIEEKEQIRETTTYTNWVREKVDLPVTFEKDDLQELLEAGDNYLFARKFDIYKDYDILKKLDDLIDSSKNR
jgi:hypothetical protein